MLGRGLRSEPDPAAATSERARYRRRPSPAPIRSQTRAASGVLDVDTRCDAAVDDNLLLDVRIFALCVQQARREAQVFELRLAHVGPHLEDVELAMAHLEILEQ